ncbi:flagellar biosynthetic protein FliR [Ectobacillus antri]|jgi:flagellar biosynthetic protein FliR|uniref:Flagellar biosynthetic protein FliR n=1 Tax=Ectobacillus antri TaxID=2486280 RepID=A0ABT6H1M5_9BACI|nr:flagellar biosynthetic protein FliR [Ectobacillus antri]MDG4656215.1 flagellar biosynthetic protein FliR [Ectobacillus antri]MDG5752890.1 flagellar biosynthetic protein FliR [Ectobacillus antri]
MTVDLWLAAFLAFCRIGSFLFFLPIFSGRAIPVIAKTTFGMALAFSVADQIDVAKLTTLPAILAYVVTQLVIGISLAKIVEFLFVVPKMAGHILDMDLGISQATLFDINTSPQSTILSTIFDIFFVLIFIAMGGLDYLVATILKSFEYTETAAALLQESFIKSVLATLLFAITSAVQIALPIMGSLFLVNFVLILIGKQTPQLNIFMNAFVVKITFGIFLVGASVPMFSYVFKNLTNTLLDEYTNLFNFFLTK